MLPSMYVKGPEEENSGISFDRLAFSNCEEVVCTVGEIFEFVNQTGNNSVRCGITLKTCLVHQCNP